LYVQGVTDHTVNAPSVYGTTYSGTEVGHTTTQDPLSAATAWLYTKFYDNTLIGYSNTESNNNALQNSIWGLEDELTSSNLTGAAKMWCEAAIEETTLGTDNKITWNGIGNVRILNLFLDSGYTKFAQDQLHMISAVPEPQTYAMLLAGLGLIGTIARRRKSKQA
jgi:hypothetical protein